MWTEEQGTEDYGDSIIEKKSGSSRESTTTPPRTIWRCLPTAEGRVLRRQGATVGGYRVASGGNVGYNAELAPTGMASEGAKMPTTTEFGFVSVRPEYYEDLVWSPGQPLPPPSPTPVTNPVFAVVAEHQQGSG